VKQQVDGWLPTHVDPGLIIQEACKGRQTRQACMQVAPGN